jgi:hypothetical protein
MEYASVAWNSVTITDSNKLDRILRKFAALFHSTFFQDVEYHYDNLLEKLNLLTLHIRHRHSDTLFLINFFYGAKCFPLSSNSRHSCACSEHTVAYLLKARTVEAEK